MELPTTRLVSPDGLELVVNQQDVERLLAEGWTSPSAGKQEPKSAPAPAASIPTRAPRAQRTEPPTATPVDPS